MNEHIFSTDPDILPCVTCHLVFLQVRLGLTNRDTCSCAPALAPRTLNVTDGLVVVKLPLRIEFSALQKVEPMIHCTHRVDEDVSERVPACFPILDNLTPRKRGESRQIPAPHFSVVVWKLSNSNHSGQLVLRTMLLCGDNHIILHAVEAQSANPASPNTRRD